tara:strand:+ start:100 stop:504 length:405 start_codon:yes stop_codon:yes gene_type:complete
LINYSTKPFRVRYAETDQMGFAHHSNYLKYFEMARIEWLTSIGFSYKKLEGRGTLMPVVTVDLKFKSPCYFDDLITVHLSVNESPKASIFFKYLITNELKKEVASGSTRLAFIDKKNRIIRCPKNLMSAIQKLM